MLFQCFYNLITIRVAPPDNHMFKVVIETKDQCNDMFKVNNKDNSYISICLMFKPQGFLFLWGIET